VGLDHHGRGGFRTCDLSRVKHRPPACVRCVLRAAANGLPRSKGWAAILPVPSAVLPRPQIHRCSKGPSMPIKAPPARRHGAGLPERRLVRAGRRRAPDQVTVKSSLDGLTTLPVRLHWQATPVAASAPVTQALFQFDGKDAWLEHNAPYDYGDDGGWLVTTFLTPGTHTFTVRIDTADGQSATDTVTATVSAPPHQRQRLPAPNGPGTSQAATEDAGASPSNRSAGWSTTPTEEARTRTSATPARAKSRSAPRSRSQSSASTTAVARSAASNPTRP
jgi:hypothetical protein